MIKKIVLAVVFTLSSVIAGTVGGAKDGKIYDKAYMDIFVGPETFYQYVEHNGAGFEVETRTLNKIYRKYEENGLGKEGRKFNIFGKLELPSNVSKKVAIIATNCEGIWSNSGSLTCTINGKRIEKKEYVNVQKDKFGTAYVNFKIEFSTRGPFMNLLKGITFKVLDENAAPKRGEVSSGVMPVRLFVDEE